MKKLLILLLSMGFITLNSKSSVEKNVRITKIYPGQGTFSLEKTNPDLYIFMQLFGNNSEAAYFTPEGKITDCVERHPITGNLSKSDNLKCEKFRYYFEDMLKAYETTHQ